MYELTLKIETYSDDLETYTELLRRLKLALTHTPGCKCLRTATNACDERGVIREFSLSGKPS